MKFNRSTAYALSVCQKHTVAWQIGSFSIVVKKGRCAGTYELSKNFVQKKNSAETLNLAGKRHGFARLNGHGLITMTGIYTVNSASHNVSLTVVRELMVRTISLAQPPGMTLRWKGDRCLYVKNVRDFAEYDKTAYGKAVIARTSGTLTLLFKDSM